MARILTSASAPTTSGRLSGWTFQKSKYGQQVQKVAWGVNRKAKRQGVTRAAFRSVVSQWRDLTQFERDSWALSAKDQGGAYEAYVSFNIPYWIANHEILRFNPATPDQILITHADSGTSFAPTGAISGLQAHFTADVNWEVAGATVQIYFAATSPVAAPPTRADATLLTTATVIRSGTILSILLDAADFPTPLLQFPGAHYGFWVTPVDDTTAATRGAEQVILADVAPYWTMSSINFTANAHGGLTPVTFSLQASIRPFGQDGTYQFQYNYLVGSSPTTPWDSNQSLPGNTFSCTVSNDLLSVTDHQIAGSGSNLGLPGNIVYLFFSITNNSGTIILTRFTLVSAFMQ